MCDARLAGFFWPTPAGGQLSPDVAEASEWVLLEDFLPVYEQH